MNSFEMYDPSNGQRKRYSLQEGQVQPQQPTYSSQDIRNNKYLGGLINNTNNTLDKAYNQVAERKSYDMPSINHSLLTNRGFNEALNRVQATNRIKLDEKRRNALMNMFSSTMSGRNNLISNATNEQNNRRTIANSAFQAEQGRLEREKLQNDRLAQQQQQFDTTMDFNKDKFAKNYQLNENKFDLQKQTAGIKPTDMKNRANIFDTMYKGYYDENTSDALDGNEILKSQARNYYIQHGKMPILEAYNGGSFFGKDYRIANDNSQQQMQQQMQQQPQHDIQKVVGNKKYIQKNGKWYEL